jgi:hypothetical protein
MRQFGRHIDLGNPVNRGAALNRSLVSWWKAINQGPYFGGARFLDLCGKNHGAISGAKWDGLKPPGGNGALSFDGTDDYVLATKSFNGATAISVSCWFLPKVDTVGASKYFLSLPNSSAGDNGLDWRQFNATVMIDLQTSAGSSLGTLSYGIPAFWVWIHLVITWDGATLQGYADGASIGTVSLGGTLSHGSGEINLGRFGSFGAYANCYLDDVRIYDRALSPSKVAALYRASRLGDQSEFNWVTRPLIGEAAAPATGFNFLTLLGVGGAAA